MCGDELPLQPYSQQERDQVQKYLQTVDVLKDPA
jgi:hypothetical protein